MRRGHVLAALLLATAFAVAAAGRSDSWSQDHQLKVGSGGAMESLKFMLSGLRAAERKEDEKGERVVPVAVKYEVPANMHDKFLDEWERLEKKTGGEKGVVLMTMKKYISDNVNFILYAEWETADDAMEHCKTDYFKSWMDFIDKEDIMFQMYPMMKVTDDVQDVRKGKEPHVASFGKGKGRGGDDPRDSAAHVMIEYHVPPSKAKDFVDMWDKVADCTADEKDNLIYSLRKVATMNHHYIVYGTWETFDAYMDHFTSKCIRELKDFAADNEMEWFLEPLKDCGTTGRKQQQ